MVGIFIVPIPLVADRLDREVGRGRIILMGEQPDRGHRDRHQDQHRHQRPDDLQRGIVGGARRRRIGAAPVAEDRPSRAAASTKSEITVISGIRITSWNQAASWPIGVTCSCRPRRPSGWPMPGVGAVRGGAATAGAPDAAASAGGRRLSLRRRAAASWRCAAAARRRPAARRLASAARGRQAEGGGDGGELEKSLHLNPLDPPVEAARIRAPEGRFAPAL